jgi:predicted nucleic acid-binding protein
MARDPKDDKFLATAKAVAADYLVSEDEDLLVLEEYEGTRIVNAAAFLRILESGAADFDVRNGR